MVASLEPLALRCAAWISRIWESFEYTCVGALIAKGAAMVQPFYFATGLARQGTIS